MCHPNDRDEVRAALDRVVETEKQVQGSWRIQTDGGKQRLLEVTVTPAGSNGQITARRGAVSDVTEQHERRRELKQLLKTVPDCVVKLNREGEFVFANERARKVLGVDSERVIGRAYDDPDWDLRGPDGHPIPEEELPFRQIQETEAPVYGEKLSIRWPDGPRRLLVVNGAPLFDKDGAFDGAVFSLTDATGIQERQRELKSERRLISQLLDALDDHLQHFRVNIPELAPPRFEVGELSLYLVAGGNAVGLVEPVEDVVVQLPTSIDVVQKRLSDAF